MKEKEIDISVVMADAEAIRLIAAQIYEEMDEPYRYLAHAVCSLAEHQLTYWDTI